MFCKYCKVGTYTELCQCLKTNETCYFVRRCNTEKRWKPLNSMYNCKLQKEEVVLKHDEYKVRFEHKGNLYIEIGDRVIKKQNPYDYVPNAVKMVNINGEMYFKEFAPKAAKKRNKEKEI